MNVLVAHLNAETRILLRAELEERGFHVVAETSNGLDAIELANDLHPDIVMVQMDMPAVSGIEIARQISRDLPHATFVLLNSEVDACALGDLPLTGAQRRHVNGDEPQGDGEAHERFRKLTARQREILALILSGCSNKVIGMDLGISRRTVENHRAQIMKRTASKSLPELARTAFSINWNQPAGVSTERAKSNGARRIAAASPMMTGLAG
jgi:two-component system CheB/CheR fusion protein